MLCLFRYTRSTKQTAKIAYTPSIPEIDRTRKSKTEAVLQRRSMLKLGVICKFMKRYGKCFMS